MAVESDGGGNAPVTTVIMEIEYRTGDLRTAKHWALRHARWIFREDEVEAVSVDAKLPGAKAKPQSHLPITERYLTDPVD